MSAYSTRQAYGGQLASVGRIVLLAAPSHDDPGKVCLRAGIIVAISSSQDRPYIQDFKTGHVDWGIQEWSFFNAAGYTPDAVAGVMPVGTWAWPPRLP